MNAHNMSIPVRLRTYQSREPQLDGKIWEAARATSATPIFFKLIEIGRGQPLIDGGLGCNNPSQLVLDEANICFENRPIGCLVSIGSGQAEIISLQKPTLFRQIVPTDVIDTLNSIAADCEKTHEYMLRLFENLPNAYFRLNVDQGMQGIQLSQCERLTEVEAHTSQYMKRREVDEKLTEVVNAIRFPRGQLTIKQLRASECLFEIHLITHSYHVSFSWACCRIDST